MRGEIPEKFGFEFNRGSWNSGFVVQPGHVFLFVTLEKSGLEEQHRYNDGFVSPARFHWQSQNQTKQDSKRGRLLRDHESLGERIHLFVRPSRKIKNKTCPFTYCGQLRFVEWQGEQPINVVWDLETPLSDTVINDLKLSFAKVTYQTNPVEETPQAEALVAETKILEIEPTGLANTVVSGSRYLAQKEQHSRFRISDDLVIKLLSIAERSGGVVSLKKLSLESGLSNHRLTGALTTMKKLLNFDGLMLLHLDRELDQVSINIELLRQEFDN